jgi:positive regulator of sigma E activity
MRAINRLLFGGALLVAMLFCGAVEEVNALNISSYKNTLSSSAPGKFSNHTFNFTTQEAVPVGATVTIDFPSAFAINSSTLLARNVEMLVNGASRPAAATPAALVDGVSIVGGAGGQVMYTLSN